MLILLMVFDAPELNAQGLPFPFYQDETVKVVIGFTPGGFYDRWARLLSRYMPTGLRSAGG